MLADCARLTVPGSEGTSEVEGEGAIVNMSVMELSIEVPSTIAAGVRFAVAGGCVAGSPP